MYCTLDKIKELTCWKTIGTANERKCWAPWCPAWDLLVEVTYLESCPHCKKSIKGADVTAALDENPVGYCSATRRR
jgi:hypothetical protein